MRCSILPAALVGLAFACGGESDEMDASSGLDASSVVDSSAVDATDRDVTTATDASEADAGQTDASEPPDAAQDARGCEDSFASCSESNPCSSDEICGPNLPAGWLLVSLETDGVDCTDGYVDASDGASRMLIPSDGPAPASCTCECSGDAECTGSPTRCDTSDTLRSRTESCIGISYTPSRVYEWRFEPGASGASCTPMFGQELPPIFDSMVHLCELHEQPTCSDRRICMAAPAEGARLCIRHSDPAEPCPSGFESLRLASDANDQRACSDCTCLGECTQATYALYRNDSCSSDPRAEIPSDGACHEVPAGSSPPYYRSARLINTEASCAPSGGEPTGDVTLSGEAKVCCVP